jgi:hypothetical protein
VGDFGNEFSDAIENWEFFVLFEIVAKPVMKSFTF